MNMVKPSACYKDIVFINHDYINNRYEDIKDEVINIFEYLTPTDLELYHKSWATREDGLNPPWRYKDETEFTHVQDRTIGVRISKKYYKNRGRKNERNSDAYYILA